MALSAPRCCAAQDRPAARGAGDPALNASRAAFPRRSAAGPSGACLRTCEGGFETTLLPPPCAVPSWAGPGAGGRGLLFPESHRSICQFVCPCAHATLCRLLRLRGRSDTGRAGPPALSFVFKIFPPLYISLSISTERKPTGIWIGMALSSDVNRGELRAYSIVDPQLADL